MGRDLNEERMDCYQFGNVSTPEQPTPELEGAIEHGETQNQKMFGKKLYIPVNYTMVRKDNLRILLNAARKTKENGDG